MAASIDALTQQVIQLGTDLQDARQELQRLRSQVNLLEQAGGGERKTNNDVIDRKKLFPT